VFLSVDSGHQQKVRLKMSLRHDLPAARTGVDYQVLQGAWMPTFRTGGGFSLTQRSPRPRAAHDNLPPQAAGNAQPKYLSDLLHRAPEPKVATPKQQPYESTPERGVMASGGHPVLTLELPTGAPRMRGIGSAPAGVPVKQRRSQMDTPPTATITAAASEATGAAATTYGTASAASARRRQATPAAPTYSNLPAEPLRRGPSGHTPRHCSKHSRVVISAGISSSAGGVGTSGAGAASPTPAEAADGHPYAMHPGSPQPRAAGGGSAGEPGSPHGPPLPATFEHPSAAEHGADGADSMGGLGGTVGSAGSKAPPHNVAFVPIPSMRHAHHLASIPRPAAGPRFPPGPPAARDESALHRVSNYSIRPCIHDTDLSARFGAKAACRGPSVSTAAYDAPVNTVGGVAGLPVGVEGGLPFSAIGIDGAPSPMGRRVTKQATSPRIGGGRGGGAGGARPPRVTVTTNARPPPAPSPACNERSAVEAGAPAGWQTN